MLISLHVLLHTMALIHENIRQFNLTLHARMVYTEIRFACNSFTESLKALSHFDT